MSTAFNAPESCNLNNSLSLYYSPHPSSTLENDVNYLDATIPIIFHLFLFRVYINIIERLFKIYVGPLLLLTLRLTLLEFKKFDGNSARELIGFLWGIHV